MAPSLACLEGFPVLFLEVTERNHKLLFQEKEIRNLVT